MALPTPKREPRQAREGATVARKGVAGPSCIWGNERKKRRNYIVLRCRSSALARRGPFRYERV